IPITCCTLRPPVRMLHSPVDWRNTLGLAYAPDQCSPTTTHRRQHMSWFDRLTKRKQPPLIATASDTSPAYHNPIDRKTYIAEAGWTRHTPASTSQPSISDSVRHQHVRLLSPQQLIAANVSLDRLTAFLKIAEAQVKTHLCSSSTSFELLVQFSLFPDQAPQLQMAIQRAANEELLQQVYDALVAIEPLRTRERPISFQMHFLIEASVT